MAIHPIHGIALCAGVGMLDEGLRAAFEYLGIEYRTAAYVEREAAAASQLVALMEAGVVDQSPVWSDLITFDGRPWRGKVDCITAGFPCQPHSVVGKREGLDDERWIWPDIARIIRESEPWLCWFENVHGLVSTGGLEHVLFDLAKLGFDVEWGVIAASQVGASHQRERVFILAYRRLQHLNIFKREVRNEPARSGCNVEYAQHAGLHAAAITGSAGEAVCRAPSRADEGGEPTGGSGLVDDAHGAERRACGFGGVGGEKGHDGNRRETHGGAGIAVEALGDTDLQREQQPHHEDGTEPRQRSWPCARRTGSELADSSCERLPRRELGGSLNERIRATAHGPAAQLREVCLFAPPRTIRAGEQSSMNDPTFPRRLNPAFACWLMGWPWWWTNPAPTSFAKSEMALYRSRQQQHLSCLLGEQEFSEEAA